MRVLTPRERALIALGLLVLAIALLWLLIVGPLVGGFVDRAQERQDLRAAYARNERLIGSMSVLRAAAESQTRTAGRFAVSATSEALAVEALKQRLQQLSADEGFTVKAIDDLQSEAPTGTLKLRTDLTLTLNQLYETLRRLQNEDVYVAVDYVSISADRSVGAGKLEPLDVRLELSTAWRAVRGRP